MSRRTKLAAVDPKPTAPQKGFRQSSSRVGGGAASVPGQEQAQTDAPPNKIEVARKIGALWAVIKEESGFVSIPNELFQTVAKSSVTKNKLGEVTVTKAKDVSKTGLVAACVLAWLMFRHRPDEEGRPYFEGETLRTSRGELANLIGVPKSTISRALRLLEALGAIRCELKDAIAYGTKLVNHIHIEIVPEIVTQLCLAGDMTCANSEDRSAHQQKTLSPPAGEGLSTGGTGIVTDAELDKKTAKTPQGVTTKKATDEETVNRRQSPSVKAAPPPGSRQPSAASPPAGNGYQMRNTIRGTPAEQASKLAHQLEGMVGDPQDSSDEDELRHQDSLRFLDFFSAEHQARFKEKPRIKTNDTEALRDHMRDSKWSPIRYAVLLVWAWNHIGETAENKDGSTYSYVHCVNSQRLGYFATHIVKVISDTNAFNLPNMQPDELWPALCKASQLDEDELQEFFRIEWEHHEAKAQNAKTLAAARLEAKEAEQAARKFKSLIHERFCAEWIDRSRQSGHQTKAPYPGEFYKAWDEITKVDAALARPGRENELIELLFERCGWDSAPSGANAKSFQIEGETKGQSVTPLANSPTPGAPPPPPPRNTNAKSYAANIPISPTVDLATIGLIEEDRRERHAKSKAERDLAAKAKREKAFARLRQRKLSYEQRKAMTGCGDSPTFRSLLQDCHDAGIDYDEL